MEQGTRLRGSQRFCSPEDPRNSKITDLDIALLRQENVQRLDIPVHDLAIVAVLHTEAHLSED